MWKELFQYVMDHYRFGTIARQVAEPRAHDDPELRLRMGLRGDFPRRPRNGLTVATMALPTIRT